MQFLERVKEGVNVRSLLLLLVFFLCACSSNVQERKIIDLADGHKEAYFSWERRSSERKIDIASLNEALLKAGGVSVDLSLVFPDLPKSLLLFSENSGLLSGHYANGTASRWESSFRRWCESVEGVVKDRNRVETVMKYAAVSSGKDAYRVLSSSDMATCFDSFGIQKFGVWDPIVSITLVRPLDRPFSREGYLVVQTNFDNAASRDILAAAQLEYQRRENEYRYENFRKFVDARAGWESSSRELRNNLKNGDSVSVIMSFEGKKIVAHGMVVDMKRPLAKVQFSSFNPAFQWIDIEGLFVSEVPQVLYCYSLSVVSRDCFY